MGEAVVDACGVAFWHPREHGIEQGLGHGFGNERVAPGTAVDKAVDHY